MQVAFHSAGRNGRFAELHQNVTAASSEPMANTTYAIDGIYTTWPRMLYQRVAVRPSRARALAITLSDTQRRRKDALTRHAFQRTNCLFSQLVQICNAGELTERELACHSALRVASAASASASSSEQHDRNRTPVRTTIIFKCL